MFYKLRLLFVALCFYSSVQAQNEKLVQFSGVGRAIFLNNKLGDRDTVHADRSSTGYILLDQAFNIRPNASTEIQSIMRLRNEYGGFYGSGASLTFRQLYIRGVAAQRVKYQFGDIDLGLTRFTLFNNYSEGNINEAAAFKMTRDIAHYENFETGNTWRQQGGQAEFTLNFPKAINAIHFNGFMTRNRATNFFTVPEMLQGGGSVTVIQNINLTFGGNYFNLFSLGQTIKSDVKYSNPVATLDFKYIIEQSKLTYYLKGETGRSSYSVENDPLAPDTKKDYFYEVTLGSDIKKHGVNAELTYRNVGAEFYSAGAQTKRVSFDMSPQLFPKVTNYPGYRRDITLLDLTRDPTIYNQVITSRLMYYDVRLNNAMPYGVATPNRTGEELKISYEDSAAIFYISLYTAFLSEIRGQGTSNLRKFMLIRPKADLYLNKVLGWNKKLKVTAGYQLEQTKRDGTDIEAISLTSSSLDGGLEVELFKSFDILMGLKILNSKGNEFLPLYNSYNTLIDYIRFNGIDTQQRLLAGGVRYNFNPNIFFSIQGQFLNVFNNNDDSYSYDIRQIYILYNMKF